MAVDSRGGRSRIFDGFASRRIATDEAEIFVRIGGDGPPIVCLHGFPQTHVTWRKVAPALAATHTVVVPDLRGCGESEIVASDPHHAAYSKRAMARDVLAVMRALGHERFVVAGHDRGGRVAYRLALDAPDAVRALAVLDIVPTLETYEPMTYLGAYRAYHWYFLAQPAPLPERLIEGDRDFFLDWTIESWTERRGAIEPEAMAAYRASFGRPGAVHAACEDYRAGWTRDMEDDRRDRDAGRRIACPVLSLWSGGATARKPIDFLAVWRRWADDVHGGPLDCGHFLMEEAPEATIRELLAFVGG